jgi:hypothetical protein
MRRPSKGYYIAKVQPAPPAWVGDTCEQCGKAAPWTVAKNERGDWRWYALCADCHEAFDVMTALQGDG